MQLLQESLNTFTFIRLQLKTPFIRHMITAMFSKAAGDSQDEKGQRKFSSKRNIFPMNNSTSLNKDLLTERGIGLGTSFQAWRREGSREHLPVPKGDL